MRNEMNFCHVNLPMLGVSDLTDQLLILPVTLLSVSLQTSSDITDSLGTSVKTNFIQKTTDKIGRKLNYIKCISSSFNFSTNSWHDLVFE